MAKKHITTDELAALIQRNVAHKEDIAALRADMMDGFNAVAASMRKGFEEVTELLRTMNGTLTTIAKEKAVLETDHSLLEKRVATIEKRLRIKR